jgi:hypothetical protein
MGSIVFLYVAIGIVCGICLTVSIVISALVRSNNIGQNEEKKAEYVDYTTFVYHAKYDSHSAINYFDGYYKE